MMSKNKQCFSASFNFPQLPNDSSEHFSSAKHHLPGANHQDPQFDQATSPQQLPWKSISTSRFGVASSSIQFSPLAASSTGNTSRAYSSMPL